MLLFNGVKNEFCNVILTSIDHVCLSSSDLIGFAHFVLANSDGDANIHVEGMMSSLLFTCLIE